VSFLVRFTEDAENDLIRLYEFILNKEEPDWTLAARAIDAIKGAICALENSPFSYRKAGPDNPFLRTDHSPRRLRLRRAVQDRGRQDGDHPGTTAPAGGGLPLTGIVLAGQTGAPNARAPALDFSLAAVATLESIGGS
jgi:plasmid stabilization system protein ParE